MDIRKVPKEELASRMNRFTTALDKTCDGWEMCAIVGGMSMFYLTGTICDGVLLIQRGPTCGSTLWVRKSYQRAVMESEFHDIRPMTSFRDISNTIDRLPDTLYLDMSEATLEWHSILSKYMRFDKLMPIDNVMLSVRAVKSRYEIDIMKRAGDTIDRLLHNDIAELFYEGMSEAELGADIYSLFVKNGYHGVSRFSMRNSDVVLGHIGFSISSLYPSVFNGASGLVGLCPAAPVLGSRDVKLRSGDIIYIDVGFGIDGYNVDKTLIYSFKKPQSEYINDIHNCCLDIEKQAVSMLNANMKPSYIYETVCEALPPELRNCFMGTLQRRVPFLGHGVGLYVNEHPVIAKGFDQPLECSMTIAIEPKMGIEGVGMVGSENTYLITESGAVSLTGDAQKIVLCG